ncbi:hypothetical protein [Kribbella catacumbae]|uniref:hypothetical protein n=1 Tax=Kribbella catacumbae TaxID=460086 RepID=UPI000373F918|nr:hypothetical protein [Kribbella catacumbae]
MTTRDLHDLLDSASERRDPFTPDPAALATAGRRRARTHRAMTSGAIALVAASALVVASLVGAALKETSPPAADAPAPDRAAPAHTDLCSLSDNYAGTARNHPWTRQVATYWTTKVLEVADEDGTMTVRQSPDGTQYAYCVAGVPVDGVPTGGTGSAVVNEGIITRETEIVQYWAHGCRTASPRTYRNGYGNDYGKVDTCFGLRYSYAGKLPPGVTRVRLKGLGQDSDARQAGGFWAARVYTPDRLRGLKDPITLTMYDAEGRQVFTKRYS